MEENGSRWSDITLPIYGPKHHRWQGKQQSERQQTDDNATCYGSHLYVSSVSIKPDDFAKMPVDLLDMKHSWKGSFFRRGRLKTTTKLSQINKMKAFSFGATHESGQVQSNLWFDWTKPLFTQWRNVNSLANKQSVDLKALVLNMKPSSILTNFPLGKRG